MECVEGVLGLSAADWQLDELEKLAAWMRAALHRHVTQRNIQCSNCQRLYADYDDYRKRYPRNSFRQRP